MVNSAPSIASVVPEFGTVTHNGTAAPLDPTLGAPIEASPNAKIPPAFTVNNPESNALDAFANEPPTPNVNVFNPVVPRKVCAVENATFCVVVPTFNNSRVVNASVERFNARNPFTPTTANPAPRPVADASTKISVRTDIVVVPDAPPP
jgi:hypothetical protein